MIQLKHQGDCCGCEACAIACPKKCITMQRDDKEGFAYPVIDSSLCIDCHRCEQVCPMINHNEKRAPLSTYAATNPDDTERMASSSGGIFSMLARNVITCGGIVFGVAFSEDFRSARHIAVESEADLARLRGSKYFQASTADSFAGVRSALVGGRMVLFTGTPCQVKALRLYLGAKMCASPLLLLVDIICHGVPSPEAWATYLDRCAGNDEVVDVQFRDKAPSGWHSFCLSLKLRQYECQPASDGTRSAFAPSASSVDDLRTISATHREDLYMQSFLRNVNLRPSCYGCRSRGGSSGSDITIGDFWSPPSQLDDNCGLSAVMVYTERGKEALDATNAALSGVEYARVAQGNPCLEHNVARPRSRKIFWKHYRSDFAKAVRLSKPKPSAYQKLKYQAWLLLHALHLK